MIFHAPQIIICVIFVLNLGMNLAKHGEPKNDNYSFWVSVFSAGVMFSLLIWGGFFK